MESWAAEDDFRKRFNNIILYCYNNNYTPVREDPVTLRNKRFNTEFKYIILLRSDYIFIKPSDASL